MSGGPAIPNFDARRAMPAASFLDRAADFDIDGQMAKTEAQSALVDELRAARDQVTALARRLIEPEWLPLLEWLLDVTLRRPMILPNMGPESVTFIALREGQNQIVWQILRAIAEGREEQAPLREGT